MDAAVPAELTLQGTVTIDWSVPAPRVRVTVRCGAQTQETLTADDGTYSITTTADVGRCPRLLVEVGKEALLPVLRVVHVPPPTSPLTLDVDLTGLVELQCGSQHCAAEGDPLTRMPSDTIKRGWVAVESGPSAVDHLAGELRDATGNLLRLAGFGYLDLRGAGGDRLETIEPFTECFAVGTDGEAQLVDTLPFTDDLEMNVYGLDVAEGRWTDQGPVGYVAHTSDYDEEGNPIIVRATRTQLGYIRSGRLHKPVWFCAPLAGSGWIAWGVAVPPGGCVSLRATNQCGCPLGGVVFGIRGQGFGYRADSWTDGHGWACLEVSPSEDIGEDDNHNEIPGETFRVDAKAYLQGLLASFPSHELPREEATCGQPESCVSLEQEYEDFDVDRCP